MTSTSGENQGNVLSDDLWRVQPLPVHSYANEVHVWRSWLDHPPWYAQRLMRLLTPDERNRAGRFYFPQHRERFIVARGVLRCILSRYLCVEPESLYFCYNEYGKPELAKGIGEGILRFNVSHSHDLALFAVTRDREIGVDIEKMRPGVASEHIAEQFFAPEEVSKLRALPGYMQDEAFFRCWTRKEAYIKAKGEGLSMPLDQFEVSLAPGEKAALLSTRGDPQEASRWSLVELLPEDGFVAAVAAQGNDWILKCWQWPEGGRTD